MCSFLELREQVLLQQVLLQQVLLQQQQQLL
jgi:hypothetical protein